MRISHPTLTLSAVFSLLALAHSGSALAQPAPAKPAPPQPAQPAPAQPAPAQPAPAPQPKADDRLLPDDEPTPPPAKPVDDKKKADDKKAAEKKAADDKKVAEEAEKVEDKPKIETKVEADKKGPKKKGDGSEGDTEVFAEEWWASARPTIELHGYYRVRSELYSHFALGRHDDAKSTLWPQPSDNTISRPGGGGNSIKLCGDNALKPTTCDNNIQAGANMRFRINPELHISDNVRILAQIDLLDNIALGSTPDGYSNQPANGGYRQVTRGGYTPLGTFSTTQWVPQAGQNSFTDSIRVKRVWGEYMTPIGLLRFGRMPSHWGLGMVANSGDGYDSDYASTSDRLMFVTGIKKWDLYFGALWDFVNEGPTSSIINEQQGQAHDLAQQDDVDQYGVVIVRRRNADLQKLDLAKGKVVINGGFYGVYRKQNLEYVGSSTAAGASADGLGTTDPTILGKGYVRRHAQAFVPDLWIQFLYKKFRFEAEAALIAGSIENTSPAPGGTDYTNPYKKDANGWNVLSFGMAMQSELRAVEDKLHIQMGFGYATGDQDVANLAPSAQGLDPNLTHNRTFSTFRFHPDYRIDYILWRNILNRVQGAYYFRPSVTYDFTRDQNGQRIGGGGAVVWSRASEFVQTPGHQRDLGVELDFQLYYQAKDGSLNDDLDKMGGFYTSLQYGVMFPLGGLGYLSGQKTDFKASNTGYDGSLDTAQIVRWYLGIMF